jgi:hypothetical protein
MLIYELQKLLLEVTSLSLFWFRVVILRPLHLQSNRVQGRLIKQHRRKKSSYNSL